MNRGLSIVLILGAAMFALLAGSFTSTGRSYFDPALLTGLYPCSLDQDRLTALVPMEEGLEDWFAQPLRAVGEPSLYWDRRADDPTTTLRLTLLPSFFEPVIVRIDDLYGETPRLTATRSVGQVELREGPDHLVRVLSRAEIEPVIAFLASSRVLNQPPDSCLSGVDGTVYLIEANGPEGYRFVNRWSPGESPVLDLGNMMYQLTGWPSDGQKPYLNRKV